MSKTLLLADDSSTIQRVVELTFAQEDIRVISVADGEQALKSIDRERPDIVLADVGMPRVDGYSVSSHVKRSATLQHIPVLLLTGAFEPVDDARAKAAQCDGVLVKPFEPRALVTRVQELLNSARAAQEAAAAAAPPNGRDAATPADPGHAVPSWYKPERPATVVDRPPTPAIDAADLDQKLAGLTHQPPAAAAAVAPTSPAPAATPPAPAAPAAAPEPLVLDLGSFTPVHGPALAANNPEPLELAPMPRAAASTPPSAVPELSALPGDPPEVEGAATESAPAASKVSLSSAFSALLAAEQSAPPGAAAPAIADHALEDVVRRVLLNDKAVRKLVLDAAERMVKEEIERIKSDADTGEGEPGTE